MRADAAHDLHTASALQWPCALAEWRDELRAFPGRTRAAARLTIVTCATIVVGLWLQVPALDIAAYIVIFSYRPSTHATAKTCVGFAVLGFLAALLTILFWSLTADAPTMRVAILAAGVFIAMYARTFGEKGVAAYGLATFTVCMITFSSLVPDADLVTRLSLKAALGVAIASLLSAAGAFLLYPSRPSTGPTDGPAQAEHLSAADRRTFALRATAAAMAGYLFYNLTDWFGIHTCMYTILFICTMDRSFRRHKGTLRITGAALGGVLALLAIVFVVPYLDSVAGLLMLVAPVTFLAAWVAVGSDRLAYAGLQLGLAFYLALLGSDGPTSNLSEARDRVVGVLVGVIAVWLAFDVVRVRQRMPPLANIPLHGSRAAALATITAMAALLAAPSAAAQGSTGNSTPSTDAAATTGVPAPPPACAATAIAKPPTVRVRLRDGSKVNGRVTAYGVDGCTVALSDKAAAGTADSTRTVLWISIIPGDVDSLAAKVLGKKEPADLLLNAELLALAGEGNKADAAFDRVLRSDRALAAQVEASKARARDRMADAEHTERIRLHGVMAASIPTQPGGPAPWPILSRPEHEAAVESMKRRAEEICATARVNATLVETRYFLLYAATRPEAAMECARSLDAMYEKVLELFGIPPGLNLFWGKAVVLLQPNEEVFRVVEGAAFGQMTPPGVVGLCHMAGPQVFLNIFWSDDQDRFDAVLLHEAVHGIMHRYHSAARIPAWADEGLSEYIAAVSFKSSPVDGERRPQAVEFIRSGGNVAQIMRLNYQDRSWPGPNAVGYAVGYAVVELMIRQQPERFGRWIRAVKGGKPWEQALAEDFGFTTDQFAATATEWYRRGG